MTDTDDDMFAGMIAEALAPSSAAHANARGMKAGEVALVAAGSGGRHTCPCGSGQLGYNLFDHTGKLLMYCCHACEKPRRALLKDVGGRLTEDG
jgi:hypothetical protein